MGGSMEVDTMSKHLKITFANRQVLTTGGDTSIRMQAVDDSDKASELNNIYQLAQELELLEAYRRRALRAWDKFDSLYDKLMTQLGDRTLPQVITELDVSAAEVVAIHMQQSYFTQYYLMGDCTCLPDSATACDVCQAQIKAKSMYREEM
jgi:hypothetical protein